MIKPLSRTEGKALRMFSYGVSYKDVADRLGLTHDYAHSMAYHIRQKTGIKDTKDPAECKAWLDGVRNYIRSHFTGPTKSQLAVMSLLVKGMNYTQIAQELELSLQSAQNYASQGCKRAGIIGKGHYRTTAIAKYLETLRDYPHTPAEKDPLDEY